MGKLRDMMVKEMKIRGFSPHTQRTYLERVRDYVKYHGRSPDQLNPEHIKQYQWHLTNDKQLSASYFNQVSAALRFFYLEVLGKDWNIKRIPYRKLEKKLPVVLDQSEMIPFLEAPRNIKHRAILKTIYSAGLRVQEAIHLRPGDIDSKRMVIHVRQSKGRKDRYVPLSPHLLEVLREYWQQTSPKPSYWLFPGQNLQKPINRKSVQLICVAATKKAGINKHVTPHTLRHSFATHLLEAGVSILVIQRLLGHASLRTTAVYIHVAQNYITDVVSPLDVLLDRESKKRQINLS